MSSKVQGSEHSHKPPHITQLYFTPFNFQLNIMTTLKPNATKQRFRMDKIIPVQLEHSCVSLDEF